MPDEVAKIRAALKRKIPKLQQVCKVKIIRLDGKEEQTALSEINKRFPGCYERIALIREQRLELIKFLATTSSRDLKSFETKVKIRFTSNELWGLISYLIINDVVRFDRQGRSANLSEVAAWLKDHIQVLIPAGGQGIKRENVKRNVAWSECRHPGKNAYSEHYQLDSYDKSFNKKSTFTDEDILPESVRELAEKFDPFKP
jgi:hypothetical protein